MFRFTIREFFLLTVIAALCCAWWVEHRATKEWQGESWFWHETADDLAAEYIHATGRQPETRVNDKDWQKDASLWWAMHPDNVPVAAAPAKSAAAPASR